MAKFNQQSSPGIIAPRLPKIGTIEIVLDPGEAPPPEHTQQRQTDYLPFITDQFRDENGNLTDTRQSPILF